MAVPTRGMLGGNRESMKRLEGSSPVTCLEEVRGYSLGQGVARTYTRVGLEGHQGAMLDNRSNRGDRR